MTAAASIVEFQDADRARLDRQLAVLEELAGVGLQLARAVARQASAEGEAAPGPETLAQLSLTYARAARAVETAVLLQSRLTTEHRARAAADRKEAKDAAIERGAAIERIAARVSWRAHRADRAAYNRLRAIATDRLGCSELYGDILRRPLSELVARICGDLGLAPDWPALSQELWAREELQGGAPGEPLRDLARAANDPGEALEPDAPGPGAPAVPEGPA